MEAVDSFRPGSRERIEAYRRRAASGEPIFEGMPPGIPHRPGDRNFKDEQKMDIETALDLISNIDQTLLEQKIADLETRLKRLKSLRAGGGAKRKMSFKVDPAIEQKIAALVRKAGPMKPGAIADKMGLTAIQVGRIAASSELLRNEAGSIHLEE